MSEPLTPSDCDCRGLPFMPMEVSRLVDSDFVALSTGDEFKAGFLLWAKSWSQVPAASLPDDDRILAHMVGRSLGEWMSLREMALHNWIKCSDGRLYHPVIADLAVSAAAKRKGQAERANSRWAKAKAAKTASAKPRDTKTDATASADDATAMQVKGTVEGKRTPLKPPEGADGLFGEEAQPEPPDEVQVAFDRWNETAGACGLPKAKLLDAGRRRAIRRRLDQGGLETWDKALRAVARSPHCRGENDRQWRADLDFVCQPKSWRRLLEGTYGDGAPDAGGPAEWTDAHWTAALRIWRETGEWSPEVGPPPGQPGCRAPAHLIVAPVAPPGRLQA
jgi:hypothetical protein